MAVRFILPALLMAAGVGALASGVSGGVEAGAMLLGAGLAVGLLNALFRLGVEGDRDRDREEAARRYFSRHGRWPDEDSDR